ncbi:putative ribonuclease H-like domain-containing protein [Tanacetum coccineum]|uniref:Ribonuclease H-like domain-containing protein n=1 Tax=Tanacetum coccineum TaxID=301880 RepID=A0ABQ5B0H0_9ASTR
MSSMQEDIQCAGSDTRPPMLDRNRLDLAHNVSHVIAGGTEGAVQQGPVRARVLNDLSAEEKERYKADIRATNILLQGIPKDIYSLINHYTDAKDIWENIEEILEGYYVRFTKLINDMRNIKMTMPRMQLNSKFVNNMLPEWSRFITEVKLNKGLKESKFDKLYSYVKQHDASNENRINDGKESSEHRGMINLVKRNSIKFYTVTAGHIHVNVQGQSDIKDSDYFKEQDLLMPVGEQVTNVDDDVDDSPENDLALNVLNQFLKLMNIIWDEYHDVHEKQNEVSNTTSFVDSDADYTSDSNIIPYDQYVEDNEEHVVQCNASSVRNDALMSILDEMHEQGRKEVRMEACDLKSILRGGLGHNLFSVGQFCDSDLEVAFRKHTCFVRDINGTNILKVLPIPKSWLGGGSVCLNHLNFGTINDLARKDLVRGLPRLKFEKDHLCSACQLGKSKKFSHRPKSENTNMEVLHTLHMDLCGPMRVQSIKGKKYILVIVDDYSRFTWVKFLRSKDETPSIVTTSLANTATDFVHPERSRIHTRHNKTPYELVHDKKPDLTFFRVFGALCYPTNDSENLGKFQAKADIGIFVGYAPSRKGYRIYNKRTRRLMETIHVTFDEMHQSMAPVRISSGPEPIMMTPGQLKSGLAPTDKELEMLFQPMFDEHLEQSRVNEPVPSATEITAHVVPPGTSLSTTIAPDAPSTSSAQSSSGNVNSAEPTQVNYPPDHLRRWTKDHPLDNIVGNPSRPVSTRKQLASDALWCCFHTELSKVEPKNFKMAMIEDCWFQAMQDEIHEFDRLEVWELVPRPIYVMVIALKCGIYKTRKTTHVYRMKKLFMAKAGTKGVMRIMLGCQDSRRSTVGSAQFHEIDWLDGHQISKVRAEISTTEAE